MNNIIRAERATVKFCEGVEVDQKARRKPLALDMGISRRRL
jgi:hypothetical protein